MPKLLIIDDDPSITEMLALVLPAKGFEVFTLNYGSEGVKTTQEVNPDVIILDLMMPDLDGWALCKQIREFSQVPILVLSAVIEAQGIAKAMEQGASDYLTKPAPLDTLIERIRSLIH